jgi:hypothetical protein
MVERSEVREESLQGLPILDFESAAHDVPPASPLQIFGCTLETLYTTSRDGHLSSCVHCGLGYTKTHSGRAADDDHPATVEGTHGHSVP